jgi:hypothetical protein
LKEFAIPARPCADLEKGMLVFQLHELQEIKPLF